MNAERKGNGVGRGSGVLLVGLCLLAGCTNEQKAPVNDRNVDIVGEADPVDSEIILAVQPGVYDPNRAVMEALIVGRLHVIDGCLHLIGEGEDLDGAVVIWPPETTMRMTDEGLVEIIDHAGELIVRQGEYLEMGGGFAASVEGIEFDDPEIGARLAERCPGSYWIAGDIVR